MCSLTLPSRIQSYPMKKCSAAHSWGSSKNISMLASAARLFRRAPWISGLLPKTKSETCSRMSWSHFTAKIKLKVRRKRTPPAKNKRQIKKRTRVHIQYSPKSRRSSVPNKIKIRKIIRKRTSEKTALTSPMIQNLRDMFSRGRSRKSRLSCTLLRNPAKYHSLRPRTSNRWMI